MTIYDKGGPEKGQVDADEQDELAPNAELANRYTVIRRLGAGGMGAVYEVHDLHLEEDIALKMLHRSLSSDDDYRQRLRAEVRLARRVSHPNVCRVHDLGEHNGQLFVTMELIRGATLRAKLNAIRRRTAPALPTPLKVDLIVQICSALAAAHRAGVLHRDVKPDNVVIENGRAVLTDFGVASLTAEQAANRRVVAGTPAYIAPEMLRGEGYDQRADIYACAVVAYELFSGRQPFATPNLDSAIRRARANPSIPPLPDHCAAPPVRVALDIVLAKGLCFTTVARYRSIDQLAEAIAQAVRGQVSEKLMPAPLQAEILGADTLPSLPLPHDQATLANSPLLTENTPPPAAPSSSRHTPTYDTPTPTTTTRAQVRVATALYFECAADSPVIAEAEISDILETRPIALAPEGEALERTVVDLGGTPLQVSENSIMALFGAPTALGDDAARAARAAHALIKITHDGRAGIDTARVLYRRGIDGPTASGEAIARAEALAGDAAPGEVRVSPASARQLVGRFRVSELEEQLAPDERVLLVHADDHVREGTASLAPMLGRDRELAQLEALIKDVCENRRPRRASVAAPAGYGKSRLRRELVNRVSEQREVEWIIGRATPLGEVAPLSLLRSADRRWFDAAAREGFRDGPAAFAAARRWLERRAARRPVAVLLEDVQWSDDASLDFFSELWQTLDHVPVAIILFGRNVPAAATAQRAESAVAELAIELNAVDKRTAIEIARRIAPGASREELAHLCQRAGGNPFFIEELARDQRERGSTIHPHATPLPATVEAVVQGRLDRLPLRARELSCAAAVVGREFWRESARAALAEPDRMNDVELDAILAELENRAIVSALPPTTVDDDRYVFHSALVRDVAYQQLAPRDRRRAHAAVARWLEPRCSATITKTGAGSDPTLLAAIALHRDLAGDVGGACEAYRRAGERSLKLFAYREAATALRRARELTRNPDADLLEMVGDALAITESIEAGEAAYRDALAITEKSVDDPLVIAHLYHKLATCATRRSANQEAIDYCHAGLAPLLTDPADINSELTASARAHPTVAAALYGSLGWVLGYVMTDNDVGLPCAERAVALLEDTSHRRDLAQALSRLGANYMRAGRWHDQLSCNQRNLQIARELGDLEMQLTASINLGVNYGTLGEIDKAIAHTRQALKLCLRTNAVTTLALVRSNLAGWLIEREETSEGEAHLDQAIEMAERCGNRRFLPEAYGFAARLRDLLGDLDGAEGKARHAVALARSNELTIDEGIAARILALVLLARGELAEAHEQLERSLTCLVGGDEFEHARTEAALARFYLHRGADGDAERGKELREKARQLFDYLGANRDLEVLDDPTDIR